MGAFTSLRRVSFLVICSAAAIAIAVSGPALRAQANPFVGTWNLNGVGDDAANVYCLEVMQGADGLVVKFLDRVGNPFTAASATIEGNELTFVRGQGARAITYKAHLEGDRMVGEHTMRRGGRGGTPVTERVIHWAGGRRPTFPGANANGTHQYGTPVVLFDGGSMDAFGVQYPGRDLNWAVTDGLMMNTPPSNNLVSKEKFSNFKIDIEYRLGEGSNSGMYLRGRYEVQLLDDYGKDVSILGHASIYGRRPPDMNASKPVGEWQTLSAVLVGDRVTVTLNGQRVHDNVEITGVTGGALDNNELEPGPIMIQGDHSEVAIRKLIVTPIR